MVENAFVGAWKLVSLELRGADGATSYPFGLDPCGYIFYMADGYMSVVIMHASRPHFQSQDSFGGSLDEKAGAMGTFFSYCGTWEVQGNEVVHHIEVSLFPNWTGKDQRRFYRFAGQRLTLSTAPQVYQGKEQAAVIVWERV